MFIFLVEIIGVWRPTSWQERAQFPGANRQVLIRKMSPWMIACSRQSVIAPLMLITSASIQRCRTHAGFSGRCKLSLLVFEFRRALKSSFPLCLVWRYLSAFFLKPRDIQCLPADTERSLSSESIAAVTDWNYSVVTEKYITVHYSKY